MLCKQMGKISALFPEKASTVDFKDRQFTGKKSILDSTNIPAADHFS
jgi:hypothetical protein